MMISDGAYPNYAQWTQGDAQVRTKNVNCDPDVARSGEPLWDLEVRE